MAALSPAKALWFPATPQQAAQGDQDDHAPRCHSLRDDLVLAKIDRASFGTERSAQYSLYAVKPPG